MVKIMNGKYIGLVLGVLLLISMAFAAPVAPYDSHFIADWNFDGTGATLIDVNNGTHNAVIAGTYTDSITGKLVNAYKFSTTYATVTDTDGVFKAPKFTLSMWFKVPNGGAGAYTLFSSMANRAVNQAAGWVIDMGVSGAGVIEWRMGSVDGAVTETVMTLPTTYNDGAWHNLIVSYDGISKRMYMDGNMTGSEQAAALVYNATNYVYIGGAIVNGTPIWLFDGNLDEYAFWDTNLSMSDINYLWNLGAGRAYPFGATVSATPSTTSTANGNWNTAATVTFTCVTNGGAPCQDLNYSLNSGAWTDVNFTASQYVLAVSDGNNKLEYKSRNTDGNTEAIQTAYQARDSSGPTVGATTINTFSTYLVGGNWINGSGNVIGGLATDSLSDVNTLSCQIRLNPADAFTTTGIWSVNHCTYGLFGPVIDGVSYAFNTRVKDNIGNQGTGTTTVTYLGDTVGPTTTDNSVPTYYANAIITLTGNDGTGTGVKATWYCTDTINTCTPNILGNSVSLTAVIGFVQTYYIRYVSSDYFDTNGATTSSGLITINRFSTPAYPDNNTNSSNWLTMTNIFAGALFGFDYTSLAIACLIMLAACAFLFRINSLVAIILSIPLTYAFLVLAGGASFILSAILILEIVALALRIGISLMDIGNRGA